MVKKKVSFLLALLLAAVMTGMLLLMAIISLQNSQNQNYSNNDLYTVAKPLLITNELVETFVVATMTAKSWTATPTEVK